MMTDSKSKILSSRSKSSLRREATKGSKFKSPNSRLIQSRLLLVWGILTAANFGLAWQLYQLQIVRSPQLEKQARQQQMVQMRPYIPRRSIVDRQKNVIATDRLVYSLYAHPKLFKQPQEEIATKLGKILDGWTAEKLTKEFKKKESGIRLAYTLTETVADQVLELSSDGLELVKHYSRFYPQKDMVADILGYVNLDHSGQAGVEYSQQTLLERSVLNLRLSRSGNGALMPAHMPEGLVKVDELQLQLTLDLGLQRVARFALKEQIEKFKAKRGAVIVMDVQDGSILTLVCEPTYNPNKYFNFDLELFKNWAISDLYEPGSTFKPLNVAIALDAGVIEPDSIFDDPGKIVIDNWPIYNHDYDTRGNHGKISVTKILQYSSNVGMIKIMEGLKPSTYYGKLKQLKLEENSGIDLPGETPGRIKKKAEFTRSSIEAATASFGQGFSLTPIKLIQLHASLANGGKLVTPHVVKGLTDPQGHFHWKPPLPTTIIFSPQTSRTVLEMMETVVKEGSGKAAQIPGYRIAGKTGTAQKASPNGGYFSNAKIVSFVGIVPLESPRYVVMTVIDEPQGENTFGSTVAAPIVKSVMEALIAMEKIPPSSKP